MLRIGDSDIRGKMQALIRGVPEVDIRLASDSITAKPLFVSADDEQDVESERVPREGRFIPDIAIPFDDLEALNAHVELDVGRLEHDVLLVRDLVVRADLRGGAVNVSRLGFVARSGRLDARARLDPAEGAGHFLLDLEARQFALGINPGNQDLSMKGDIGIRLRSEGADVRSLAGNANGTIYLETSGGRMGNSRIAQRLYGDLAGQILGVINPMHKESPYTEFACIVMPLKVTDGTLTAEGKLFVRTDKLDILAQPKIDFKTEKLDVTVRTTPRKGLTISAAELLNPYIKVVGTLARPALAVDEKGALVSGGAAVATGGLSVLAMSTWNRLTRSKDPCSAAAQTGIEALVDPFPNFRSEDLP